MYVRVYGADMVCRLIETCFLIHILRSISKVLGASSFCTCVEYIMLGLVLMGCRFTIKSRFFDIRNSIF